VTKEEERSNVRRLLDLDRLPRKEPKSLWGGQGEGLPCALCGELIEPAQPQLDLEFEEGQPSLRMHVACYDRWRLAVTDRGAGSP
jgi:hypothetical protein